MEKLKPCPFCGGNAYITSEPYNDKCDKVYISCEDCPADMFQMTSLENIEQGIDVITSDLICYWNTRKGGK